MSLPPNVNGPQQSYYDLAVQEAELQSVSNHAITVEYLQITNTGNVDVYFYACNFGFLAGSGSGQGLNTTPLAIFTIKAASALQIETRMEFNSGFSYFVSDDQDSFSSVSDPVYLQMFYR